MSPVELITAVWDWLKANPLAGLVIFLAIVGPALYLLDRREGRS